MADFKVRNMTGRYSAAVPQDLCILVNGYDFFETTEFADKKEDFPC